MEPPVLVDSNIYIDLMRKQLDPAIVLTEHVSSTDLATCGMVRLEVLRGIKHPKVRTRLAAFFDVLQFVPTDNRLWKQAEDLAWELDRAGWIIPATDILIACAARRIGAVVLTRDKHFRNIPGIVTRDWL